MENINITNILYNIHISYEIIIYTDLLRINSEIIIYNTYILRFR